jgi:hypothetical protein
MPTPENGPAPIPSPDWCTLTESLNCIDVYDEPIGDATPRPARSPEVLRRRPPERPSVEPPPEKG